MISFNEFNELKEVTSMDLENLEDHLSEEQIVSLNENLGNLRGLGAGKMINVFKQSANHWRKTLATGSDANRFVLIRSVGSTSEIKDIGRISSWKDIRKVVNASSKNDEMAFGGAVVYYNDKAYATINFQGALEKIGLNDVFIAAVDSSVLPDSVGAKVLAVASRNKSRWNPATQTGGAILARDLELIVDTVVSEAKDNGGKVTAKLIHFDRAGSDKHQDRRAARSFDDPLATREDFSKGRRLYGTGSLDSALSKHKASKRISFNSKTDGSKILMVMVNNPGSEIVVDGKLVYAAPAKSFKGATVDDLIRGQPATITLSGPNNQFASFIVTIKDFKRL